MKDNTGRIVFDGNLELLYESFFELGTQDKDERKDLYPDTEELEPHRELDDLRKSVVIRVYVDANNARNMLNMRSHTGILIYVNNITIIWFRKRQNTLE